jgi:hypothetical protein
MKELENDKLDELTQKAEQGKGCAIFDAINEMSYEERLAALKGIADRNDKRFSRNLTETELEFRVWDSRWEGFKLSLGINNGTWSRQTHLYNDVMRPDATHKGTCEDHVLGARKK